MSLDSIRVGPVNEMQVATVSVSAFVDLSDAGRDLTSLFPSVNPAELAEGASTYDIVLPPMVDTVLKGPKTIDAGIVVAVSDGVATKSDTVEISVTRAVRMEMLQQAAQAVILSLQIHQPLFLSTIPLAIQLLIIYLFQKRKTQQ